MPYKRCIEWRVFSAYVYEHILMYTIPQYGDGPTDEVETWTPEMCMKAIQKYTRRFESGMRGHDETKRDMLKIAHFACLAYFKVSGERVEFPLSETPPTRPGDYGHVEGGRV